MLLCLGSENNGHSSSCWAGPSRRICGGVGGARGGAVLLVLNKQLLHPVSLHTVLGKEVSGSSLLGEGFCLRLTRLSPEFLFLFSTSSEQLFSRHPRGDPGTSPHLHPCPQRTSSLHLTPKAFQGLLSLHPLPQVSACVRRKCVQKAIHTNGWIPIKGRPPVSHRQKMLPLPTLRHLSI